MNKKLSGLINEIESKYNNSSREFAQWGFKGHIQKVAANVIKISKREGGDLDLLLAAAYLHDIGDTVLERDDPKREEFEHELTTKLLKKYGFSSSEAKIIEEEIIGPHSCHQTLPSTLNGKIFSTADAMSHFTSDLYFYICWHHFKRKTLQEFKNWMKEKLDRDYHQKIQFPYFKKLIKPYYEVLKQMVSNRNEQ